MWSWNGDDTVPLSPGQKLKIPALGLGGCPQQINCMNLPFSFNFSALQGGAASPRWTVWLWQLTADLDAPSQNTAPGGKEECEECSWGRRRDNFHYRRHIGKPLKILWQSSPVMGTKTETNLYKWNSMADWHQGTSSLLMESKGWSPSTPVRLQPAEGTQHWTIPFTFFPLGAPSPSRFFSLLPESLLP